MPMKTFLVYLGMLLCAGGMCYGLINEASRPYVITLILLSWGVTLWEIKKAPLERTKE